MSFKMEVLEDMLERSAYDPVIWEDVKHEVEVLQNQIDDLNKENESLLDDFCDLIQILLDNDSLSYQTQEAIKERFIKPKD